jgi:phenylalanyl-tRNA synthetase beta chain
MRISWNWLRELVGVTVQPDELAHQLTMAGFEVEDVEDRRTWADGVVLGYVRQREQHPNADRLSVCTVDIGAAEPLTIVCGASNVAADQQVAVATVGTYLPRIDLKIKPAKLRGVSSSGMICSLAEVGLEKEAEGIHVFGTGMPENLGADVRPILGLDDVILDVSSTANRADALSLVGIAREVKALTGGALTLPEVVRQTYPAIGKIQVVEQQACPIYVGTTIAGVTIGPSPQWLQRRLLSAGIRSINNVVDITNLVLLEWGQPLHAFDGDRLAGLSANSSTPGSTTIGVRFAQAGESLKTLDGQDRSLQPVALVITGADQPIALAGVMGGSATEVFEGTTNLFLEAAWFEPVVVRKSARSQGLRSEASSRYERGVNLAELELANQRGIDLILELAGGQVQGQAIADSRPAQVPRQIELRLERLQILLGMLDREILGEPIGDDEDELRDIQPAEVAQVLTALGCELSPLKAGVWTVTVPPYRYRDLEREIDLIEEVARLYGYDNFCDTLPAKSELGSLSPEQQQLRQLRSAFRGAGLTELLHYSLVKPGAPRQVQLANPLLAEYSALRTELISGLVEAFQYNQEQNNGPLNGFEIGRVFWSDEEGLGEADLVAGIFGGDPSVGRWQRSGKAQPMSWFEAKGLLDTVFGRLGLAVEYQADRRDERLHPGRTASLWIKGERLGSFGQLHPQVCREKGLADQVYVFELELELILASLVTETGAVPVFRAFSTFPAADRDLAFFVRTEVSVLELEKEMRRAGGALLESVELFDEYRGDQVPEGKRSLAFRLVYRVADRTLTDEDVEPVHSKVRDGLEEKFQILLRS